MAERNGEEQKKKKNEEEEVQKRVAIGIDLGTTFSCVAYVKPKPEDSEKNTSKSTAPHVEVIANDQGSRTTPSYVAFTDVERHIGQPAKEQIADNPSNTVFSAKRLIGRRWNDPVLQKDIKTFPFKVTSSSGGNSNGEDENSSDYDHCDSSSSGDDEDGVRRHRKKENKGDEKRPVIEVVYKEETKKFSCEEISAMVLSKMKETAEDFIGETVTDAVITVPAYFNDAQRQATKTAGDIAGINVLSILNEPTAAAIAYGMNFYTGGDDNGEAGSSSAAATEAKNVMIFDLGGGTFDVVILCIDGGIFDVRAVGGDNHLGGEDFDLLMVDHFVKEYKRKNSQDIVGDHRAMQRLKKGCEKAKRTLSSSTKANINIDCLYGGLDFRSSITRVRFNELCSELFDKTITLVEKTLSEAQLKKSDLDDIVLVGGSSRIPKVQELLIDFFDGKQLSQNIHPDEAVAYGAAIQASILGGDCHSHHKNIKLLDVAPMSLGVETIGGQMRTIIKKNTRVPTKQTTRDFTTYLDNQENLQIQVFEGEHKLTEDNDPLGSFILSEIQSAPRGVPSIDITFELDSNGILKVSAEDRATRSAKRISIDSNKGQLGKKSIQRMIASGKNLREDDKKMKDVNEMRGRLESYCFRSKTSAQSNEAKQRLTRLEINQVTGFCDEVLEWLEDNQRLSKAELKERMEKLVGDCDDSLSKLKAGMA